MKSLGQTRASIRNVSPQIECGKFQIKRIINEKIEVEADIFGDGHDKVDAVLLYREAVGEGEKEKEWDEIPMIHEGNDHWSSAFEANRIGVYEYTVEAWIDHFSTWKSDLKKKITAQQNVRVEILIGAELMEKALEQANASQKKQLRNWITFLRDEEKEAEAISKVFEDAVTNVMYQTRHRERATRYPRNLQVKVERKRALFSAWYEFFPRSTSENPGEHGTFKSSERILPEIAKMGFDVIYLPPVHPIGTSHRKGINNATDAQPGDPGSPWAIGSKEGGHKAIHPELGTIDDFTSFVKKAESNGIEVAIDFAIQCSPDHPYVKEHPQWFKWRPDGTVQYAENPPKKYQDVLPVNFETEDWENLWQELKSVVEYWIDKGVKIFRVDNPHTKSFLFWEWLIKEINKTNKDIIFLAEAFTRPRVMEELGKVGFTQSYTYFTWRNSKQEFQEYLTELTKTELREYFRPNFWPNTPDILPVSLENKSEASFLIRIILASTLSSNYGIYGPLFEFALNEAYPGKEEYTRSEKYEVKHWDWYRPTRTKEMISQLNSIRNENPALQTTYNITFADTDNDQIISYSKVDKRSGNKLLIVVNLDPDHTQSGRVKVPLQELEIMAHEPFAVVDLLTASRYIWQNEWNYVELHPLALPAHILRVENSNER